MGGYGRFDPKMGAPGPRASIPGRDRSIRGMVTAPPPSRFDDEDTRKAGRRISHGQLTYVLRKIS